MSGLDFRELVGRVERVLGDILPLLRQANDESDVVNVLSSYLGCEREVKLGGSRFPQLIVDLLCGNLAVEVEFNKQPHVGLDQAVAYRALLGLDSVLVHVSNYCTRDFIDAFGKLLNSLKCLNIRGVILDLEKGAVIVFE